MTDTSLLVSTQNNITTIALNRPDKCNALDGELVQHLESAFLKAGQDHETAAVLLMGKGKHFCAGADIAWMRQLAQSSFELGMDDARGLASLLYMMHSFPKPIIALAQGSTLGGGLGLLACSDIVIAARDADFCFSEVKIGLAPAVVSPYVISIIGQQAARYYFLTADRFTAAEAQYLGLVQKLVAPEDLFTAGLALTKIILQHSPAALTEVKKLISLVADQEISLELTEKTAEIFARMRVSSQAQEGLQAFLEKRPASWNQKT